MKRTALTYFTLLFLLTIFSSACNREAKQNLDNTVRIRFVHPPEIQSYLTSMVEAFQITNPTLTDGTKISIDLRVVPGLDAAKDIAIGKLKTHAWLSPSSSLVNLANSTLKNLGPRQVECQQLFATPIVAAVQSRHVPFFQESQRQFSWHDVVDATFDSTEADAAKRIRLNHTSPLSSTTGLSALIQLSYLATKKAEGALTLDDLKAKGIFDRLKAYETLISSYGFNELSLLHNVAVAKTDQVFFSLTTEQQLALYNSRSNMPPLIALYPTEGSYWMDYAVCLSEADWVTPREASAVKLFTRFLSAEPGQLAIEKRGFRPSVLPLPPIAPLTREFGIDVKAGRNAYVPVPGEVVEYLLKSWPEVLRPSAIVLVLDTSGSMEGAPIRVGKDHFRKILAASSWKDLKSLISFSTNSSLLSEFSLDSESIIPQLDKLNAEGGSSVYDSIKKAFDYIIHSKLDTYRKTIVVYTDGDDKNSEISLPSLQSFIQEQLKHGSVNLIIIAVGRDSDFSDLKQISGAANGLFRQGGLDDMEGIFAEVAANL